MSSSLIVGFELRREKKRQSGRTGKYFQAHWRIGFQYHSLRQPTFPTCSPAKLGLLSDVFGYDEIKSLIVRGDAKVEAVRRALAEDVADRGVCESTAPSSLLKNSLSAPDLETCA